MYNTQSTENKDVFDIKEKLATGSFGSTIFKAYNPVLGQVAIAKKYPAAITNDYEVSYISFYICYPRTKHNLYFNDSIVYKVNSLISIFVLGIQMYYYVKLIQSVFLFPTFA